MEEHLGQLGIIVFFTMGLFYISTWEEYYTGELFLPVFNGPSEGLAIASLVHVITYIYGREVWHSEHVYTQYISYLEPYLPKLPSFIGNSNNDVFVLFILLVGTREVLWKIICVTYTYGISSLFTLSPFVTLCGTSYWIINIDSTLVQLYPRRCLHLLSCLYVEMVTQVMMDHMCGTVLKPLRKLLIPLVILLYNVKQENLTITQVQGYLTVYMIFCLFFVSFKFQKITGEFCQIFGIRCLTIGQTDKFNLKGE